jgi:ribonuclease PH
MTRLDSRAALDLRPLKVTPRFFGHSDANVLIEMGRTAVLCSVTHQMGVPKFLKGSNLGWLTAEYQMLPCSTHDRSIRDSQRISPNGRALEIQRLIGRTLRHCIALDKIGESTLTVDCDVLQADGGTRIAAINGGAIALAMAMHRLEKQKKVAPGAFKGLIGGISCGYVQGELLIDLAYQEDSQASTDAFWIIDKNQKIIEQDSCAEQVPMSHDQWLMLSQQAHRSSISIIQWQQQQLDHIMHQLG